MSLTIIDIANLCNCSKSTVSRYLNGGSVSGKTAEKIRKVIEETGFETNLSASRLKSKKSNLIGVLVDDGIASISVSKILTSITKTLRKDNYLPFIMIDELGDDYKIRSMKTLIKQGVDGIILGTKSLTKDHVKFIHEHKIPTIILGQICETLPYRKVNDYQAGVLLADYIASLNKKNIVYVGISDSDQAVGKERRLGFIETILKYKGYNVHTIESSLSLDDAYNKTKEILSYQPDVIIGATDRICMGIMHSLNEHDIKIPDKVCIAGFGNYEFSKAMTPSLTSIDFDYSALGTKTAEDMIKLVNGDTIERVFTDFPISLVKRRSTDLTQL